MPKRFVNLVVLAHAVVASAGSAVDFNFDPQFPSRRSHLSKIEMSFSNEEFFDFFAIVASPQMRVGGGQPLGLKLQDLPGLQHLPLASDLSMTAGLAVLGVDHLANQVQKIMCAVSASRSIGSAPSPTHSFEELRL